MCEMMKMIKTFRRETHFAYRFIHAVDVRDRHSLVLAVPCLFLMLS